MNWLPNLLNWPAALIASAIAIPALVALYFLKLRRKEAMISSTILWKKSVQDLQVNSPFQTLRRNLLLLLQFLILAALLFSLSRPVSFQKAQPGARSVILIDRSGSMNTRDGGGVGAKADSGTSSITRLDDAKKQAKEIVDAMPDAGQAVLIAFDSVAQTLVPMTTNRQQLKAAIDAITPTDRPTRLKLAYQLADAAMNIDASQLGDAKQLAEVFVLSDGRALDESELTLRGSVKFIRIGRDDTKNIGVVSLSARRNYERPTEVQVFARLANFGPEPVDAQVQLAVSPIEASSSADNFVGRQVQSTTRLIPVRWDDAKRRQYMQDNPQAGRDSVEFTLELTTAAVIQLTQLSTEGDALQIDDVARVVVPAPKRLSVGLVTEGNFFLERVVESLGLDQPKFLTPQQYAQSMPTDLDVILFDRISPAKLPDAGNFVFFGCVGPVALTGQSVRQSKSPEGADQFMPDVGVLDWKRDHPLLKTLNLGKLFAKQAIMLDLPSDAEVLMEGTGSFSSGSFGSAGGGGATPLIVFSRQGKSQNLHIAFDLLESNWPLRESFPIFIYNVMQFLAAGADLGVRESFAPGATPRLPRVALQRISDPAPTTLQLIGPGTRVSVEIPSTADAALPALDFTGLYQTSPLVPGVERIAVNLLDENESNTWPLTKSPGNVGGVVASGESRSRVEWWWWIIAVGGIPLLMIEWYVYTRRVHS